MKFCFCLVGILYCLLSGCSSAEISEKEPNDTLLAATPVEPGRRVVGSLSAARDRDALLFRGGKARLLSFELSHDERYDLAVDVYIAGRHVKTIDSWAASTSRAGRKPAAKPGSPAIENAALLDTRGEDCILVVHAVEGKGAWPLTWVLTTSVREGDAVSEREPNDELAQAMVLVGERSVEGYHSPLYHARVPGGLERDVYAWVNDSTNRVLVEIEVSGVPDVNPVIDLLDAKGRVRKTIDVGGIHLGEQSGPLGLVAAETCYFAIRNDVPGRGNFRIPYTVFVTSRPAAAAEEFEPNDTVQTATQLVSGAEVKAALHPLDDRDCYFLPLPQTGRYTLALRVSPAEGLDPVLDLLDHEGRLLLTLNDAGPGKAEYLPNYGLLASGQRGLVLRVRSKNAASSGQYVLLASLYPAGPFAEFEPNDSPATANRVQTGVEIRGFLFPAGDRDWLEMEFPGRGEAAIRLATPAGVKASLVCTDSENRLLGRTEAKTGDLRLKVRLAAAGRYRIGISASAGAGNPRDPWILDTSFSPTD